MIDIPTSIGVGVEVGGIGSSVEGVHVDGNGIAKNGSGMLKMRNGGGPTGGRWGESILTRIHDNESTGKDGDSERVKHYDADGDSFHFI
jgi:hypothetical protein